MDWFDDQHRARRAYTDMPRSLSEKSNDLGFFIENTSRLSEGHSVVAGARHDRMHATAYQGFWNDEAHPRTRYELNAGFARYEYSHAGVQYQAGLGYTERGPDFWERNRNRAIQPERSLQLDVGAGWHTGDLHLHGTAFANRINDYILIEKDNPLLNDLAAESTARNVDAVRYGFELGAEYALAGNWKSSASLAYTWGRDQTESRPLGQIPPLEGRLRAGYDSEVFALMGTLRAATRQNRVAFGQGNVNGVDIGPTRASPYSASTATGSSRASCASASASTTCSTVSTPNTSPRPCRLPSSTRHWASTPMPAPAPASTSPAAPPGYAST